MRTYQKLRIDSRIRSGSGLAMASKSNSDVVPQMAKQSKDSPRSGQHPVDAATRGAAQEGDDAAQDPQHTAHGPDDEESHGSARVSSQAPPRVRKTLARQQPTPATEVLQPQHHGDRQA